MIGTLIHMFFECQLASKIWTTVAQILKGFGITKEITAEQFLVGYSNKNERETICSYLVILAKSTIYFSYLKSIQNNLEPPDYNKMYLSRLNFRLSLEFFKCKRAGDIRKFNNLWLYKNVLGCIRDDDLELYLNKYDT